MIANDEDSVRLTAGAHPANTFHLSKNRALKLHLIVAVAFGAHAPPHRIPFEDNAVFLVIAVVIK